MTGHTTDPPAPGVTCPSGAVSPGCHRALGFLPRSWVTKKREGGAGHQISEGSADGLRPSDYLSSDEPDTGPKSGRRGAGKREDT